MPIRGMIAALLAIGLLQGGEIATLCKQAIDNNPGLQSAHYKTKAAHYGYEQAKDRFKPYISVSGAYGYNAYDYPSREGNNTHYSNIYTQYSITYQQSLYRPSYYNAIKSAKVQKEIAQLQLKDAKARLMIQTTQNIIELIRLKQIEKITEKKVSLLQQAVLQVQARYRLKFASKPELLQSIQKLKQAQSRLAQYHQTFLIARNNLQLLLGSASLPPTLSSHTFCILPHLGTLHQKWFEQLKKSARNNTRVAIDLAYLKQAKIERQGRHYERYPTLDLAMSFDDTESSDTIQRRNNKMAILQLNLPLYQGGMVHDRIKEALMLQKAALYNLQQSRLNTLLSLQKGWDDIQSGIQTLQANKASLAVSQAYFQTTLQAYKQGIKSLTDTYLAESDYYDNQRALINAKARILQAIVSIYYHAGIATLAQIERFEARFLPKTACSSTK